MVSASGRENLGNVGFTLAPLPYTHFDQNQELGHFGKLTPPQRGEIPEMPIAACFGPENPLFFQGKFFDFSSICWPKMGPPISDRAHIFKNLSGQKIVQFSTSTPPLSGRIPEMPKNCVLGHESAPCHPKTSGKKKKKKKKMSDPPPTPPPPKNYAEIVRQNVLYTFPAIQQKKNEGEREGRKKLKVQQHLTVYRRTQSTGLKKKKNLKYKALSWRCVFKAVNIKEGDCRYCVRVLH